MQFRSEFKPKPFPVKIKLSDSLLLVGSCFTEQIGKKLAAHKFKTIENPNGILFNPISIARAIKSYTNETVFKEDDLFFSNELWASRAHHTRFSHPEKLQALQNINTEHKAATDFIKKADWILITLGSAFVYEWKDIDPKNDYENVAANCHKIPTDKFNRRLLGSSEIMTSLKKMQETVLSQNPTAKFIFTISPVRHLREGFIENNRSKAVLIQAVHELTNDSNSFYFPAYELVIDDLRDYRFFAEDLVHPNYAATNYVWEKFTPAVIDEASQIIMTEINEINAAISHKPFNPTSVSHKKFLQTNFEKVVALSQKYSYLDFSKELQFFDESTN
ncbi:MAG: GSCFA domain-containing protein [Ferruginibacter sp.]